MFEAVLVANRGEIAVRIIRTLRALGVRSVLAASVPDRRSLAARLADEVVLLEGRTAADTYLDVEAVVAAAKATGCEAVHPGYGLLSERPDFAAACAGAGLTFVGPSPETLTLLGDKVAARDLAIANDVPVAPGAEGTTDAELAEAARDIGFPLMLKARGGGGGLGMRVVANPEDLAAAIEAARRQTAAAFGDDRLFVERYVENAHHVEVQVLADAHGNAVHLGERDCSVQRRHQKLVEETPSPVVDPSLRDQLTSAALRLMRAAGYENAGTVEFLVGEPEEGRRPFYFLEVNPRLQVEHPVTEAVTRLDLVALQLAVAAGQPLPFAQDDVRFEGHAIEFRLNAEDPWRDFLPAAGRLTALAAPGARLDTGYEAGDAVPSEYDSLVAKLVVHGPRRRETLPRAAGLLEAASLDGLRTNLPLHRAVVADPAFAAGEATVQWLERDLPALLD
ncbi:MAG: ATP-grasp domain-containing protein, partial [Dehalococcoidia bacterium]|nr:ATP-grasp domain-containing protein [Dehalococcoidia bacterium]